MIVNIQTISCVVEPGCQQKLFHISFCQPVMFAKLMAKLNNIKGMMNIVKLADCRKVIVEQPCDVKSGFKN
jgi:hypothetical protein